MECTVSTWHSFTLLSGGLGDTVEFAIDPIPSTHKVYIDIDTDTMLFIFKKHAFINIIVLISHL